MEELNTVINALKEFMSAIFTIFEIDSTETDEATSKATSVFDAAKSLFEEIKKLFG